MKMNTSATTILFAILLIGVEVNAQNECYVCSYVEGLFEDVCTPENFDPDSAFVQTATCPNGGKCYTTYAEAAGTETFLRACTTQDIPGVDPNTFVCGKNGISCCDESLCNGHDAPIADICYVCSYVEDVLDDVCSPDNFNSTAEMVGKLSCPGGSCFVLGVNTAGIDIYTRSCSTTDIPGVSIACGQNGVQCCDGDLCNGAEFGGSVTSGGSGGSGDTATTATTTASGGSGDTGGNVSLTSITCVLSFVTIVLFQ